MRDGVITASTAALFQTGNETRLMMLTFAAMRANTGPGTGAVVLWRLPRHCTMSWRQLVRAPEHGGMNAGKKKLPFCAANLHSQTRTE